MKRKTKKKLPSLPKLKAKAWAIYSRIVRKFYADHRDMCQCVSCGAQKHWKEMHAGHFIAKNKGGRLWFEWRNVHPQCAYCNTYLHGNLVNYTQYMIKMYGEDEVERLKSLAGVWKTTRAEYMDLIEHLEQCENEL
jgi:hypothetical protein